MKKMVLALLLCNALLLSGCSSAQTETTVAEVVRPIAVTVQNAKVDSIVNATSFSGRTAVATETSVTAEMAGTVETVKVAVGDTVKKGDVLLTINGTDVNNSIEQARVALESAQLGYNQAISSGSINSQITQLQSAVTSAQTAYDEALRKYELNKEFLAEGIITQENFTQIELSLTQAEQQLTNAKNNLDITQNEILPDSKEAAQKQLNTAQVSYNNALSNKDKLVITAPTSGTITTVNFKVGELIAQSAPAFVISNMNTLDVNISVTESELSRFSIGDSVSVVISGEQLTGTVREVPQTASAQTTLYTVKVSIDNSNNVYVAGQSADVVLTTEKLDQTVTIPKKALIEEEDGYYIYVCGTDNIAQKVPVTTGIADQYRVAITEGLEPDTTVVIGGLTLINEGDNLYPVEKED